MRWSPEQYVGRSKPPLVPADPRDGKPLAVAVLRPTCSRGRAHHMSTETGPTGALSGNHTRVFVPRKATRISADTTVCPMKRIRALAAGERGTDLALAIAIVFGLLGVLDVLRTGQQRGQRRRAAHPRAARGHPVARPGLRRRGADRDGHGPVGQRARAQPGLRRGVVRHRPLDLQGRYAGLAAREHVAALRGDRPAGRQAAARRAGGPRPHRRCALRGVRRLPLDPLYGEAPRDGDWTRERVRTRSTPRFSRPACTARSSATS